MSTSSLSAIQSTQDSVVGAIQNAIFRGELKLGQRILEEELAATLKISRATLREALRRLEQVGLVEITPRRGTFVMKMTLGKVERLCRLRAVIEGVAARYACANLTEGDEKELRRHVQAMGSAAVSGDLDAFLYHDREFHLRTWKIARDEHLEYILKYLSTPYFAFIATISTHLFSDIREVYNAHIQYLEALVQRDPIFAEAKVIEIHQRLADNILRDIVKKNNELAGAILSMEDAE